MSIAVDIVEERLCIEIDALKNEVKYWKDLCEKLEEELKHKDICFETLNNRVERDSKYIDELQALLKEDNALKIAIKHHVCGTCKEPATMAARDIYWHDKHGMKNAYPSPDGFRYGCDNHPVESINLGYRPKN